MPHTLDWLDYHVEGFIRPRLKTIPNIDPMNHWVKRFDKRMLSGLHAVWRETKRRAGSRPILLAGRDVWLIEVLARLEGYPRTVFRPDISSCVAPHVKEDYTEHYLLDTGFKGSVPKAMRMTHWHMISWNKFPVSALERQTHQLFPKFKPSSPLSNMAGTLEAIPKYWDRGMWSEKNQAITQALVPEEGFKAAAMITMHIAGSCFRKQKRFVMISPGRYL